MLVFYDITDVVSAQDGGSAAPEARRRLLKIPTVAEQTIVCVDIDEVLCISSDGHYTRVLSAGDNRFCNLAIGDLETRLDPERFVRVQRSHIVNLQAVSQLLREDGRLALRIKGLAEPVAGVALQPARADGPSGLGGGCCSGCRSEHDGRTSGLVPHIVFPGCRAAPEGAPPLVQPR